MYKKLLGLFSTKGKIAMNVELKDIIIFVEEVLKCSDSSQRSTRDVLMDIIGILGRSIQARYLSHLLFKRSEDSTLNSILPENFLFHEYKTIIYKGKDLLKFSDIKIPIENERYISLEKDIVLPWPWKRNRLINCIGTIGDWRQDENHSIELWLPIGISWVKGGNHSIATGIIRNEGEIKPEKVYDISKVYEYVSCDGYNYIRKQDNTILSPVNSIELAAIFEIGRIMKDNAISF